ncbi:unnamed protein product [Orchesella dallaii]|uniref:Uncharacterized protein n=1 Tax=Orchesella dallaii TaxID=48710 RepID=A0ABP1QCE3_9HEXA
MRISPWIMPLRRGVKILSIVDATLSIVNILIFILPLTYFEIVPNPEEEVGFKDTFMIPAMILFFATSTLQIYMAVLLYSATKTKNYKNCQSWLMFTLFMLSVNGYGVIKWGGTMQQTFLVIVLGIMLYKIFLILLVVKFMKYIVMTQNELESISVLLSNSKQFNGI